jgi:transposase
MSQKSSAPPTRVPTEKLVCDIRLATRKHHSAEDKIRIILVGLFGD